MSYLKSFIQVTFCLVLSFILNIIEWIPSFILVSIVNISIILLYLLAIFFAYKIICNIYDNQTKKAIWKTTGYTLFFLSYIGSASIIMIGIGYSKSTYIESYIFEDKSFYVYQNIDLSYEVSVKESVLPIRSLPIATFTNKFTLSKENHYIYTTSKEIYKKIYNLKRNKKEKDE